MNENPENTPDDRLMNPEDVKCKVVLMSILEAFQAIHMYTRRSLDQMLRPEVRSEVYNLPRTQCHQHAHGGNGEPLDTLVRALVGISQPDLTSSQVVQLGDNLRGNLADPLELCFNRPQLLSGLNGVPVFGIRTNVDVQLDVAVWVGDRVGCSQNILEAYIEGRVGMGVEGVS